MKIRQFAEGRPKKRKVAWLIDKECGKIKDWCTTFCANVVVYDDAHNIFLGKRKIFPNKNWWIWGGRQFPHERFEETAARELKEEAGIKITNLDRFRSAQVFGMSHEMRAEPVKKNGSHTAFVVFLLRINEKEKRQIRVDDSEHSKSQWFHVEEILQDPNSIFTDPLKIIIKDTFEEFGLL